MKKILFIAAAILGFFIGITSCTKDLDVTPLNPDDLSSGVVYEKPGAYYQVLAKCYGSYALTGNEGPSGRGDIAGIDEGTSQFSRLLFFLQVGTTDESLIGWGDPGVPDLHNLNWSADNVITQGMYYRLFYTVTLTNELIRVTAGKPALSSDVKDNLPLFNAEARFLRAYAYYNLLDLFGNVPFVTEKDGVGAYNPPRITRADLFKYVESELLKLETENTLPVKGVEYGRVGMSAVHFLLARLYLNAAVYTATSSAAGTPMYDKAATYAEKVINDGYSLATKYSYNFLSDNNTSPELIFVATQDGINTTSYGGTTFLTNGAYGGSIKPELFGMSGAWGGPRSTSALVRKFYATPGSPTALEQKDTRGTVSNVQTGDVMLWSDGQTLEIANPSSFTQGWAVVKFKNISKTGEKGKNPSFADTDVPLFRLGEAFLIYAEAALKGGGDLTKAEGYINRLRERAFGDKSGNIIASNITDDFILNERSRELYWECTRRSDLIRFNRFTTGTYLWPWKGGVQGGTSRDAKYNLFPLPASDVSANPNLIQNPGY